MKFQVGDRIIHVNAFIPPKTTTFFIVEGTYDRWYNLKAANGTGHAQVLISDVDKFFVLHEEANDILKGLL